MEVVIIAAVAANGVIGRDGSLPWHLPADLAHFKETTMGHPVIMGRVAFEDVLSHLEEPLPGRTNIVLSRSGVEAPPDVNVVSSLEAALEVAAVQRSDVAFVAGGATVYEQTLNRADRMILSELHDAYEGDVTFPAWDESAWRVVSRTDREDFDIVEYERIAG